MSARLENIYTELVNPIRFKSHTTRCYIWTAGCLRESHGLKQSQPSRNQCCLGASILCRLFGPTASTGILQQLKASLKVKLGTSTKQGRR